MEKVTLINHASVLIQQDDIYVLTDPWFIKPAFGSWLPTPPMVYHPAYLLALAASNAKFSIVVSHGHDDHLDDDFLKLMPDDVPIIIPEYSSKGFKKRIERSGAKNVHEVGNDPKSINGVVYRAYIFEDISLDDAIVSISTGRFIVIHANDNWQRLTGDVESAIKADMEPYLMSDRLYMSQCNLADGYPWIYESVENKAEVAKNRQENILFNSYSNAESVGAGGFLAYAGFAVPYVKGKEELRNAIPPSIEEMHSFIDNRFETNILLPMRVGDTYDFTKVVPLFSGVNINHGVLTEACEKYYSEYKVVDSCETYKKGYSLQPWDRMEGGKLFVSEFKKFVERKLEETGFQDDIVNFEFSIVVYEIGIFPVSFGDKPTVYVGVELNEVEFDKMIRGDTNWENYNVGYSSNIKVHPSTAHVGPLLRWLSMFGYVYQQRIAPKFMDKIIDRR